MSKCLSLVQGYPPILAQVPVTRSYSAKVWQRATPKRHDYVILLLYLYISTLTRLSMKTKTAILLNLVLIVLVLYSWLTMASGNDTGTMLTDVRLRSLRYFTLDSNLLAAASSIVAVYFLLFRKGTMPVWASSLKLAGTVSVSVTLLTVMVYLGPRFGYRAMLAGVNLHLHLTVPVLAILIFCVLEGSRTLPFGHTFLAVIPVLIYAAFYLGNILINGVGSGPTTNDWYGLLFM